MASRISWAGAAVGGVVGGIVRVAVAALHSPTIVGENFPITIIPGTIGIITGGVAGGTGRILLGTVVGGGLSILFYLSSMPLVGLLNILGAATLPAWWEVVAVGVIPGAIGGAVGQIATKRQGTA